MRERGVLSAFVSMVLGVLYSLLAISYWVRANSGVVADMDVLAAGLATMIVLPHTASAIIGALMNVIGFFSRMRGFILAGAILYTIALVLFPPYFFFVVIQMVLSYVSFVRSKPVMYDYYPDDIENYHQGQRE